MGTHAVDECDAGRHGARRNSTPPRYAEGLCGCGMLLAATFTSGDRCWLRSLFGGGDGGRGAKFGLPNGPHAGQPSTLYLVLIYLNISLERLVRLAHSRAGGPRARAAVDRVRYGRNRSCSCPSEFVAHHVQCLSKAAVVFDAKSIKEWAVSLKSIKQRVSRIVCHAIWPTTATATTATASAVAGVGVAHACGQNGGVGA
eukprot:scaffold14736_cov114-Isochrysis_galbana.AAC.9